MTLFLDRFRLPQMRFSNTTLTHCHDWRKMSQQWRIVVFWMSITLEKFLQPVDEVDKLGEHVWRPRDLRGGRRGRSDQRLSFVHPPRFRGGDRAVRIRRGTCQRLAFLARVNPQARAPFRSRRFFDAVLGGQARNKEFAAEVERIRQMLRDSPDAIRAPQVE